MITTILYKGEIKLDFQESPYHKYFVNDKPVNSVTSYTGVIDKSRPLIYWATGLAKDHLIANVSSLADPVRANELIEEACKLHLKKKQEAADTGTQIHEWAERFIKSDGKENKMPKDPQVYNGVVAFLKWVNEHNVKFLASEKRLYSKKYKYAGTMDAAAVIGGKRCVVDFKSSNAIYPEMRLQLAAYQAADEEETGKKYTGDKWIVRFGKKDGEFEAHQFPDQAKDFKAFLACVTLQNRLKELN